MKRPGRISLAVVPVTTEKMRHLGHRSSIPTHSSRHLEAVNWLNGAAQSRVDRLSEAVCSSSTGRR